MDRTPWTIEKIKEGFEKFKTTHGRLPKATEIDALDYLPSSRTIQSRFGGLEHLRTVLGYKDAHFGKGRFRSKIAHRVNHRGRSTERDLEIALISTFGEVFVHSEKMFGEGKNRVDFYVYAPDENFGVDIFFPDSMRTLQSNVNIKVLKYKQFTSKLYLVVANERLSQTQLNSYVSTKRLPMPKNIMLVTLADFLKSIKRLRTYPHLLPSPTSSAR